MGTQPIDRAMSTDIFTQSDVESCTYRRTKKTLITICSTTKPFGLTIDCPSRNKLLVKHNEDSYEEDVDTVFLRKLFGEQSPDSVEVRVHQDIHYDDFISGLEKGDELLNYDTFLFVFLTYLAKDDQLHFSDKYVYTREITNKLKEMSYMHGKPKLLLIQADSYGIKTKTQADAFGEDDAAKVQIVTLKIPTDSDFISIISTLPGKRTRQKTEDPSLLVKAFGNILQQNWHIPQDEQSDFLSMTVQINGEFNKLFGEKFPNTTAPIPLPVITSTLTKLLYI